MRLLSYSGIQVHCISVGEHIWVGGGGPKGVGELPAGGIRASQGTFSRIKMQNLRAGKPLILVAAAFDKNKTE